MLTKEQYHKMLEVRHLVRFGLLDIKKALELSEWDVEKAAGFMINHGPFGFVRPRNLRDFKEKFLESIEDDDIGYWPFSEPINVAVFTSIDIIKEQKPILYVTHDADDGAWQFHGGELTKTEDAIVIALKEIYKIDKTIGLLANLELGCRAERKSIDDPWRIRKINAEE